MSRLVSRLATSAPRKGRSGPGIPPGGPGEASVGSCPPSGALEVGFDAAFVTRLALREKQIQQNYRPVIGIHKWFARRPGSVFRSLLLSEFKGGTLSETYWEPHALRGTIGDPFMGGGTPIFEANRLGFDVVGADVNPMAYWIVRQSLTPLSPDAIRAEGRRIASLVEQELGELYSTRCLHCQRSAPVKYFLWVKTATCPACSHVSDLFPGYRLAEAVRHPRHVVVCGTCGELNEFDEVPRQTSPAVCTSCTAPVHIEGPASRGSIDCSTCETTFSYPQPEHGPPRHRLWAIEYNCPDCYGSHKGRLFKSPDDDDLSNVERAAQMLSRLRERLPIPDDPIPAGDESDRLHRWGYRFYHEMFNERQLLGLGLLLETISTETQGTLRDALVTVFSDFLRYQNMLCRYDTYALKCQDIFSVHGFPVGLIQCENSLLGIPGVGSGSFRHFIEKYARAKEYCAAPFEVRKEGGRKTIVPIPDETIAADLSGADAIRGIGKRARLICAPSQTVELAPNTLDGVFTDPPYFDNVQYAELIDFCYVWIRRVLCSEHHEFAPATTRVSGELTGNGTLARGLPGFTAGLSAVFGRFATALKPGAPFVFTYHHNDPGAYVPLGVAILDAGLTCTAVLPAAAEMAASLHIAGTASSVLDYVFVCRSRDTSDHSVVDMSEIRNSLKSDIKAMTEAGLPHRLGDLRCLLAGHIAAHAMRELAHDWDRGRPLEERMAVVSDLVSDIRRSIDADAILAELAAESKQ